MKDNVDEQFKAWLNGRKAPELRSTSSQSKPVGRVTHDRVNWMPESREARGANRWRGTTSVYRALTIAERSLCVRTVDPKPPIERTHEEWCDRILEQR